MTIEDILLVFADPDGAPRRWRLVSGGNVVGRGDDVSELPAARPFVRVALAVPGTDVTVHWLDLAEGLTMAQAAAAARLRLADAAAEPIDHLHVAAGRSENGLACVALVPAARMSLWVEAARALGLDPDLIVPEPLLLLPPGEGLVVFRGGAVPDYRGTAQAFSLEDDLAALMPGVAGATALDEDQREAGFGPVLADPPINLRQGVFARRRALTIDWRWVRRLVWLTLALLLVTAIIEMVTIVRTTQAADRIEAEAARLRAAAGGPADRAQAARFGPAAAALFDAVRETPTAELTQVVHAADGTLRASLLVDSPATIEMVRQRIQARGLAAQGGLPTPIGGRVAGDITIRGR